MRKEILSTLGELSNISLPILDKGQVVLDRKLALDMFSVKTYNYTTFWLKNLGLLPIAEVQKDQHGSQDPHITSS